jgi:RNA polymerase sigma-70 factor, ECF subfamily
MPPSLPDDDTELMQLAGDGHFGAFETLVRRHQQPLLNFFLRSGVDRDAEDLVQKTFIRLYRYRKRYRPTAKFTTFLYLLARQVWIDELRRRRRQQRLREQMREQAEADADAASSGAVAGFTDELQQALARLSPRHREVIVLGVLRELEYAAVARILGIPVGTVKSRMFNGLRELRKLLEAGRGYHE